MLHSVAHGYDFLATFEVARDLNLPFLLSVHDDVRYALRGHPGRERALRGLSTIWKESVARFVICDAMEEEYKTRYGDYACTIVTDGIEAIAPERPLADGSKSVYFMGLMHQSYAPNFEALAGAISQMKADGGSSWRAMIRCGRSTLPGISNSESMDLLPFGDERQVELDMQNAGVLYLPLPFDRSYADFVRFSLSTKLVTYLASGVPILYHGPQNSAAYHLLSRFRAAEAVFSLDPMEVAKAIRTAHGNAANLTGAARNVARERFLLKDQRERFWGAVPVRHAS